MRRWLLIIFGERKRVFVMYMHSWTGKRALGLCRMATEAYDWIRGHSRLGLILPTLTGTATCFLNRYECNDAAADFIDDQTAFAFLLLQVSLTPSDAVTIFLATTKRFETDKED